MLRLSEIFPDEDYRFSLRVQRGSFPEFFGPSPTGPFLVAERSSWIDHTPSACVAWRKEGGPLLEETLDLITQNGLVETSLPGHIRELPEGPARCAALGRVWEPDFLLLDRDQTGLFRLQGGCVCFPSSWDLQEKIGKPLDSIHSVVPQLNQEVGDSIETFLSRMKPGVPWLRSNWGLSRSQELNQHPARQLPRLDAGVALEEVWLRLEFQALVALPRTRGVLFGIRIAMHPLAEVLRDPAAVVGLARALRTMPEDVARYKGLATARRQLLAWLSRGP